ncbi:MAG: glucose-6-phosphate isomerase, partial [Nonlabens sp.]
MLNRQNPTQTEAWASLERHFEQMKKVTLQELFNADPKRFEQFSLQQEDLLVDFSKNNITDKTLQLLVDLAQQTNY